MKKTDKWTTIDDIIETKNTAGPVKVLGNDFIIPETEKGELITKAGLLNGNTLVLGTTGSGKTVKYVIPNIKANLEKKNFVWTGCFYSYDEIKNILPGYNIKYLDVTGKNIKDTYNPFKYITGEKDIIDIADILSCSIISNKGGKSDPFWNDAVTMLMRAIFLYAYNTAENNNLSFYTIKDIICNLAKADNHDNYFESLFDSYKDNDLKNAISCWQTFKLAPSKSKNEVIMLVAAFFSRFDENVKNVVETDSLNIDDLFIKDNQAIIIPCAIDSAYSFIAAMLIHQITSRGMLLQEVSKTTHKLVDIYLDEFANYDFSSFFPRTIAVMRNYGINIHMMLQTLHQGYNKYGDDFDVIIGNCDTKIYMNFIEHEDVENICDEYFKNTRTLLSIDSKKAICKHSEEDKHILDPDALLQMDSDSQLVFVGPYNPMFIEKVNINRYINKLLN